VPDFVHAKLPDSPPVVVGFFRRAQKVEDRSPILEFWRWWATIGEARLTAAIGNGDHSIWVGEISLRVAAIHPELQWETGKGRSSQHALCVTAAGVAALRPLAERWFRASPPTTGMWEFSPARQPDPSVLTSTLEFSDVKVELSAARISIQVDDVRQRLDVKVFHPAFAVLGNDGSRRVTYLLLDWLLGEDDVERWLGEIATVLDDPPDSVPAEALSEVIVEMAARHVEPVWVLAESTTPSGRRLLLSAMRPLRWIDHPLFDLHTEIQLQYSLQRDDGLPTAAALEALRDYENRLIDAMGDRGLLVAYETFDGQRVFHVYTDSEDQNARDIIDSFQSNVRARKTHSSDPSWKHVQRFA
jgi:hypothetical protein